MATKSSSSKDLRGDSVSSNNSSDMINDCLSSSGGNYRCKRHISYGTGYDPTKVLELDVEIYDVMHVHRMYKGQIQRWNKKYRLFHNTNTSTQCT